MSSDRQVLKAMRKRLCAIIGEAMADAMALESSGHAESAKNLRAHAERLGKELQHADKMLELSLPKETPQAKPTWAAPAAKFGDGK